jgi:hypothetical protein
VWLQSFEGTSHFWVQELLSFHLSPLFQKACRPHCCLKVGLVVLIISYNHDLIFFIELLFCRSSLLTLTIIFRWNYFDFSLALPNFMHIKSLKDGFLILYGLKATWNHLSALFYFKLINFHQLAFLNLWSLKHFLNFKALNYSDY